MFIFHMILGVIVLTGLVVLLVSGIYSSIRTDGWKETLKFIGACLVWFSALLLCFGG